LTVRIQRAPQATIKINVEIKINRSKSAALTTTSSNNIVHNRKITDIN